MAKVEEAGWLDPHRHPQTCRGMSQVRLRIPHQQLSKRSCLLKQDCKMDLRPLGSPLQLAEQQNLNMAHTKALNCTRS
jgi:hypothetical protein